MVIGRQPPTNLYHSQSQNFVSVTREALELARGCAKFWFGDASRTLNVVRRVQALAESSQHALLNTSSFELIRYGTGS